MVQLIERNCPNVETTTVTGPSAVSRSRQQFSSKHPDMSCCPSNVTFSLCCHVCVCPIFPPFPIFPILFLSFSMLRCVLLLNSMSNSLGHSGKNISNSNSVFSHINNSECIKSNPSQPRAQPSAFCSSWEPLFASK